MALYDPQEFPEVKTGFTLADVLAWARTKPADETYRYVDPGNCAVCQFLRDTGRAAQPRVVLNLWRDGQLSNERRQFDDRIQGAANNDDQTFGGLASRLEKALSA